MINIFFQPLAFCEICQNFIFDDEYDLDEPFCPACGDLLELSDIAVIEDIKLAGA